MNIPSLDVELALREQGYDFVAGLDEAGRGAWAGPVVAAAVVLPLNRYDLTHVLRDVRDSKQLSPVKREALFCIIQQTSLGIGVGVSEHEIIDRDGIVRATQRAMEIALTQLTREPDYLLLDYIRLTSVPLPQKSAPKADAHILSVAAASIVAKVTRDRIMMSLDRDYPGYGFSRHKGYGTAVHRTALARLGPCPIHRMSFAPLRLSSTS